MRSLYRFVTFFFLVIWSFLSSTSNAGEVYKWVDENGKVHYSDRPRDENAKAVEIKHKVTPKQQQEAREQARKLIEMQQRRVSMELENRQEQKRNQIEQEQKAAEIKHACKEAEKAVRILEYQAPVYQQDETGMKFLKDDERKRELARLKAEMAKHCVGLEK